jgi:hypothetical protein
MPQTQPATPEASPTSNPFQGLWRVYWPSWDGTPPELKHLPVIEIILHTEQNRFSGTAFFYHVRNDGEGEYVEEKSEGVLSDLRMRGGALFFRVHRAGRDTAYKLWLVNRDEAKLCVVGEGPATVFRVKRGQK